MGDHEYRIEVWDREGGERIETCCRSTNWLMLQAAWKAAVDAFPGRFLIQYNGDHVTGRAEVPEAPPVGDCPMPANGICLFDLPEWYELYAECDACGHVARVDRYAEALQKVKGRPLMEVATKLKCAKCKTRGKSRFLVRKIPR